MSSRDFDDLSAASQKFTFRLLIPNFSPFFKDSIKARHPQFWHLQNIEDLLMHYTVLRFVNHGK